MHLLQVQAPYRPSLLSPFLLCALNPHLDYCTSCFAVTCSPPKGSSRTGTVSYSALLPQILAMYLIWKFSIKICNLWDVDNYAQEKREHPLLFQIDHQIQKVLSWPSTFLPPLLLQHLPSLLPHPHPIPEGLSSQFTLPSRSNWPPVRPSLKPLSQNKTHPFSPTWHFVPVFFFF